MEYLAIVTYISHEDGDAEVTRSFISNSIERLEGIANDIRHDRRTTMVSEDYYQLVAGNYIHM